MSHRVIVTPTADKEALQAFHWYAQQSVKAATAWVAGLSKACNSLAEFPERFPVVHDDSAKLGCEVRLMPYGRRHGLFKILYTIDADAVWILRIRHTAQAAIMTDS